MKHNLPTSTFRQELESLKQLNGRLQRLVTNCTSSGFPAQGKQPNSPPRLSPNILKENTAHAKDLYYAICNSYNCQCPYPHEANIGLRQVSPKLLGDGESFELIFPVDEEKEDMIEVDLKSPISPSYSSITSTEMAYTEESYDTFSLGYDIRPPVDETIMTDYTVILTDVGHQGIVSRVCRSRPAWIIKAAPHLHGIKEAAQFHLAGAIMARKMLDVSTTYAYLSKSWTTFHLSLLRLHV